MWSSDYVIAAICPTHLGFKIAFTDPDDFLLDWMDFGEEEIYQMMRYLRDQKKGCNDLRVIGCPNDRWPLGLVKIFEGYGHRPQWVDPELARQVVRHQAEWNRRRKYHRARTLGHLYRLEDKNFMLPDPKVIVTEWERRVAQESISECDYYNR